MCFRVYIFCFKKTTQAQVKKQKKKKNQRRKERNKRNQSRKGERKCYCERYLWKIGYNQIVCEFTFYNFSVPDQVVNFSWLFI